MTSQEDPGNPQRPSGAWLLSTEANLPPNGLMTTKTH